jgi:DNA helicase IV
VGDATGGQAAELAAEQAHVDRAYERLDQLRSDTEERLRSVLDQGQGGTHQFREERDVIVRTSLARLDQLDIGDQALCFGRIDRLGQDGAAERFHIGRLGVSAADLEPLVVDWRAPVAEPFYRATGRDPMGLVLRRHLAAQGRRIVGLEDERFGRGGAAPGAVPAGLGADGAGASGPGPVMSDELEVGGPGALLSAVEGARTGHMRDIVATIQREQDEIIRSPLPGVLVVQGGPGTGKTAVALHRAAYLLYTHRFPLERQGVLVIGPNPLFLRYIEQVLPSLGESGVTLSTITGLVHGIAPRAEEPAAVARLKGDARMATLVARAVRTRQRPLRRTAEIPFGAGVLRLTPDISASVVAAARRRPGTHNARRRFVEQLVVRRLADEHLRALRVHGVGPGGAQGANGHGPVPADGAGSTPAPEAGFDLGEFSAQLRRRPELLEALDRMWPRLSAEELIHDLFGSPALLGLAAKGLLGGEEQAMLVRPRRSSLADIPFTAADMALIDEARVLLGARRGPRPGAPPDAEEPRTYGHIVVDEAQDLSPMQLRMVARRSLSGSVTVVGDVAQATGPWAPRRWEEVTSHLPALRPPRLVELTVSYRTPAEVVELSGRILRAALPGMSPPTAVRRTGVGPRLVPAHGHELGDSVARLSRELVDEVAPGTVAVLAPRSLVAELSLALDRAGAPATDPRLQGLGAPLSLLPADLANGLEFDAVLVVEPAALVEESPQGLRALYVAMTRPTRRLTVVHDRPLPDAFGA